jgi:hypothetical protein
MQQPLDELLLVVDLPVVTVYIQLQLRSLTALGLIEM